MADITFDTAFDRGSGTDRSLPLRHVLAVTLGNALEFYDFIVYGFFAVYIGQAFFPSKDGASGLLLSLATFGAGFLTRPVGAIVIGAIGDRAGRKPAMILSFTLMGIAIFGLSLTPPYARIGIAAPLLALFFRLLQGFALGGEMGPSTAFLAEAAAPHRRGLFIAMQLVSQNVAALLAGGIGVLLAGVLDAQALQDWGWRVAMLVGALIVPFGLLVRRSLPETLHGTRASKPADPDLGRPSLPSYLSTVALCLLIIAAGTIGTYVGTYQTTYALTVLHLPATIAFGVTLVRGIVSVPSAALGGWLSDRFGRKPPLVVAGALLLASILPGFWLVVNRPSVDHFYAVIAWLSFLAALTGPATLCVLTESLPAAVRCRAVSIGYAFVVAVFGGSAQFIVAWLTDRTHDPLSPAYYWTGAVAIGFSAMVLVRESAPRLRGEIRGEIQ
jgi:MFS family permease